MEPRWTSIAASCANDFTTGSRMPPAPRPMTLPATGNGANPHTSCENRNMRVRFALAALLVCGCALAEQTLTVDQLLSFIRSSVKMKMPDKEVAGYLAKVKLSERLDERTVEELQGEGAGPKTVAALDALATASESLAKPQPKAPPKPAYVPPPPPSSEEQQEIISEMREYAMNYSKGLPDFICTQVTRKYYAQTGKDDFHPEATVVEHLTYFDQQEHYKVTMVNDHYVDLSHEAVGGAVSTGDFGSLLRSTLTPKADAMIEFDHWGTLRGNLCYVFSYHITSGNSDWSVSYGRADKTTDRVIVGYRGLIYVDKKTHKILRITFEATEIPRSFPVHEATDILDYGYQNLSGNQFLLPLKAQVYIADDRTRSRNDIEFRMYNKYSADATIQFDTEVPAPLPDDQTTEQPAQPQAQPPK